MQLKEWAFLGNYEFFNSKLKALATNELPPEKWSYAGKSDFGILRSYLYFTFEKLWQELVIPKNNNSFLWMIM